MQLRLPILCRRSRPLQTPKAFDVVSNRREMNLEFGFGKPDPSHRAKMIAAFPGAENFLDARPDWPQRAVVRFEPFGGQPAMALAHELRCSAFGLNRHLDRKRVIGLVAINFARRIGDDRRRDSDVGLVSRGGLNGADEARVLMGGNMRLIAMHAPTLQAMTVIVLRLRHDAVMFQRHLELLEL